MKRIDERCIILLCLPFAVMACGVPAPTAVPENCSAVTDLFPVSRVLADPEHPCFTWLDETHGRVARSATASATVWTRRTEFGNALVVSAFHTLGIGLIGPAGVDLPETLRNPLDGPNLTRVYLVDPGGVVTSDLPSPAFLLYHPGITAAENANSLRDVLPARDFYIGVLDAQKLSPGTAAGPLRGEQTPLYDPSTSTTSDETFAAASPGGLVLLLGYPTAFNPTPFLGAVFEEVELTAGVGRVLSDRESAEVISALGDAGDEEGDIAYDPQVEIVIEGAAAAGMSGGGVFNREGVLVGVIVRATETPALPPYVRAVRMTYIAAELQDAFDALPGSEQMSVQPFVETAP